MKKLLSVLLPILFCCSVISLNSGCSSSSDNLTDITLNEVAHSVFYTPLYAAMEKDYFKDEGLHLTLVTGFGADKTMTALLSGDADIGFMGPETTVYAYNEGASDPAVNFALLTQRAGNFLIARNEIKDFSWSDLQGKTVLGGRKGGMPEMVFEYILKQNHINPATDLTIIQNIDFGSTAAAFSGGQGDFSIEFEPGATLLEAEGNGYVVASLGVDSGYIPYTSFCAKSSYIEENPQIIQAFTNAIQKGLAYVNSHSPEDIAKTIAPQFKDTDLNTLTAIITRYANQNTWKTDTVFEEKNFQLLLDILEEADELSDSPSYEKLVNTDFSKKASTEK